MGAPTTPATTGTPHRPTPGVHPANRAFTRPGRRLVAAAAALVALAAVGAGSLLDLRTPTPKATDARRVRSAPAGRTRTSR
ncbi:hypothetical protein NKG94_39970 [Micromonospora sp. M12]